jgi:hypothetical protein
MVESKGGNHVSLENGAFFGAFRVCERGFHDLLREKLSPCSCYGMEVNLYCFPYDVFHASGFHGQDIVVLKLDIVTQVYVVLGYS